jgi:fucose 4-O-acetylase-like acetyltransferase
MADQQSGPHATLRRMRWMDVLRGAAILLVMLSHSTRVLADVLAEAPVMDVVDAFFEPYRMPMLMFLSGMLLPVALAKPLPAYYLGKVRRLVWPYVVWVVLLGLVGAAPGPLLDPRTWYATSYLWYVFFLLCYFAVAPLGRRLPPAGVVVVAAGLVVASVPLDAANDGRTKSLLYLGAFFALGHAAASAPRVLERLTAPRLPVTAGVIALGLVPGVAAVTTDLPTLEGAFAVLSLLGVLATIVVARAAVGTGGTRFVEWIGRNSIVFYAVHFPFLLALAGVLESSGASWGPLGSAVAVVVAFALALGVGCTFTALRGVGPVGWLFELPRSRRAAMPSSPVGSPGEPVPVADARR